MFLPLDFLCWSCFSLSQFEEAPRFVLLTAAEALFPFVATRFPVVGTRFPFPTDDEGFFLPVEPFGIFFPIEDGVRFPLFAMLGFRFPMEGAIFPADVDATAPLLPMEGFCFPGILLPILLPPLPLYP